MKDNVLRLLMCLSAIALWAPAASAQETTKPSKGELIWVGAPPADVTFNVTVMTDSTKAVKAVLSAIVMDFEGDKYPFIDVAWDGTQITFSLMPGDRPVACVLVKQDGDRFAGHCPRDSPALEALIRINIDSLTLPAVEPTEAGSGS
jgi:hypothetical protein